MTHPYDVIEYFLRILFFFAAIGFTCICIVLPQKSPIIRHEIWYTISKGERRTNLIWNQLTCWAVVSFREGSQFIVVNNNPSQDYNRSNALVSSINFTFLSIDWNSLIVGKISPWLDLDSTNEIVKKNSELVSRLLYYFTFNNHYW